MGKAGFCQFVSAIYSIIEHLHVASWALPTTAFSLVSGIPIECNENQCELASPKRTLMKVYIYGFLTARSSVLLFTLSNLSKF